MSRNISQDQALISGLQEISKRQGSLPDNSINRVYRAQDHWVVYVKPIVGYDKNHSPLFRFDDDTYVYISDSGDIMAFLGAGKLTNKERRKQENLLRHLHEKRNEESPNHGLESTSAPPAAGTLETHP